MSSTRQSKTIAGLIAIAAIVALGTVTTLAAEPTLPPGYTWYEDKEFKFKIAYPEGWTVTPKEEIGLGESTMNGINLSTVGAAMFMEPDTPNIIGVSINSVSDVEKLRALISEMCAKKSNDKRERRIRDNFTTDINGEAEGGLFLR